MTPGPGSGPRTPSTFITTPYWGCSEANVTERFFPMPASAVDTSGGFAAPSTTVGRSDGAGDVSTGFADGVALGGPLATIDEPSVDGPCGVGTTGDPLSAFATKNAPNPSASAPNTSGVARRAIRMRASARCMLATMRRSCGSFGAYASARL